MTHNKILIVDDEKRQREILELILTSEGYRANVAASGEAALRMVKNEHFDLVLTDLKMGGMSGLELMKNLTQLDSSIIVILMTAHGSIDSAKEAIRHGAFDYLEKPLDQVRLLAVISQALGRLNTLDGEIIGQSEQMERLKKLILKVAASDETVLIRGESGTGKELIAKALHKNSSRVGQTFQAVNCAAINENLLESELFGHEKGSFTGAYAEKKGLFEMADKGTLFLDEIGELNVNLQAKLLRALQEGEIQRVGATKTIKIDVRVVTATNRDLEAMVKDGKFREDLYYRLNVIPVEVPPLRSRRGDILVLAEYFLKKQIRGSQPAFKFSPEALRLLQNYTWPGNVRQLESAIKRAVLLCEGDRIEVEDLPLEIRQATDRSVEFHFKLPPEGISFEEVERSLIIQAMDQTDWNITRAAKLLGLTFRTLQYRLEKFNLRRPGR
ncbi:MAG TPA: sigma-54 dependent transcriptional regulator, partial [Acidobacteriota bacterium]|nr:sigma-54 dependent transcriptional regulator [Acidobacteriota bacterium]HND20777.1 sigma-54 dependent transcriptional regulator [Acidobacteriota bacterium]HNG93512.1 sigma-54 dependent transcriptional regulator [Acidobacteriota bacterium]